MDRERIEKELTEQQQVMQRKYPELVSSYARFLESYSKYLSDMRNSGFLPKHPEEEESWRYVGVGFDEL